MVDAEEQLAKLKQLMLEREASLTKEEEEEKDPEGQSLALSRLGEHLMYSNSRGLFGWFSRFLCFVAVASTNQVLFFLCVKQAGTKRVFL